MIECDLPAGCRSTDSRDRLADFVRQAGFDPAEIVDIYEFGDAPALIDRLAALVVEGPKRATTSLLRWYAAEAQRLPVGGDLAIVIGSNCRPCAIIRVTRVDIRPFRAVDDAFASDEGEGDRSLAYWRAAHQRYFQAEAARGNFTFNDDDDVVLCRFDMVWPNPVAV